MVAFSLSLLFMILYFLLLGDRDDVLGWLLVRSLLSAFPAHLLMYSRFDLVWFHQSRQHGCYKIRSGLVNVR